jgi:monofunctional biosynthetic peptidoglycan transglycosylase
MRWAGLLLAALAVAGAGWYLTLPDGAEFAKKNPPETALMNEREAIGISGRPVTWLPLSQIAPSLRHAVIVAEDAKFYRHHGIDWEALWDALERNWKERRLYRGGSTITQQLAKNLYLDPEKTLGRKLTEALIALRMERRLSKARILELYLNVVEWGRGVYGAEAAARHHFGKSAAELTIGEAAWLAAMLPAPLRYELNPDDFAPRAALIQRFVERRLTPQTPPPMVDDESEPPAGQPEPTDLPIDPPIDPQMDTMTDVMPEIGKTAPADGVNHQE